MGDAILSRFVKYEEFKKLMDKITFEWKARDFESFAVLSGFSGEGRTMVAILVATGFADFHKRKVLIVDMDQKAAVSEHSLELAAALGVPEGAMDPALKISRTQHPKIDLLRARDLGNTLKSAAEFGGLVKDLSADYEMLIFDTAAINEAHEGDFDPILVARSCQGSILVTSSLSFEGDNFMKISEKLGQGQVRLTGVVSNKGLHLW